VVKLQAQCESAFTFDDDSLLTRPLAHAAPVVIPIKDDGSPEPLPEGWGPRSGSALGSSDRLTPNEAIDVLLREITGVLRQQLSVTQESAMQLSESGGFGGPLHLSPLLTTVGIAWKAAKRRISWSHVLLWALARTTAAFISPPRGAT
jgi:hypothetical protein